MMLRRQLLERLPVLFVLFATTLLQVRADEFNCLQSVQGNQYNLTSLGGEHQINRTRSTPPTTTIDSLTFNLCDDLKVKEDVQETDQCPSGTRACLTQINVKGEDSERIISVIPLAQTEKLRPNLTLNRPSPEHLTLIFHGSQYPPESTETTPSVAQSLKFTLWCEPQQPTNITIVGYDGSQLEVEYFGIAGCPLKNGDKPPPNDDKKVEEPVGSGLGWFFMLIFLAFIAYFAIGAYYNYTTYGARGADLIPHRDFWQEVPYMLSDVVSHLCSSAKPRRTSRNGYIQV
ncbi:hypothetical protein CC1G_06848 [Coprinopsis cinerea okayama7|uniref:Autophagy-related protein 27 n=1 Tax=Coprinopsis cinerea (strain Okayama-7 / 130 / ATCC MYA-4618 / FGSC 9003) TaxID=240176 RepID=A8N6X6_COPC7|nr:hypothetical protein CC1G_06848 [Coprinopsis cinerea okayama7\|eukprot:XP_001830582.2 hypothetical protein CC1G_06848 [Coprinopsis cinerea okayama7\